MSIKALTPSLLWSHFYAMNQIPRASKKEAALRAFYCDYAVQKGWGYSTDQVGNVLIKKAATPGYERAPKIILQGHLDMVCQKNSDSPHDFDKDPIDMVIDGDWVKAKGTTLGADNGIGVAAALAILEDATVAHGPLAVFLTVDEEAGMGGVRGLQPNFLEGDYLINLDSETWGKCCVGCAGGADINILGDLVYEETIQGNYLELTLNGLKGGHSGLDIHSGRGNANQLLAEVLSDLSAMMPLRLVAFEGGTLRNALTREARAAFAYDATHYDTLMAHIAQWQQNLTERLQGVDDGVCLTYGDYEAKPAIAAEMSHAILALLTLLPHGVITTSTILPVVETSCNIGTVHLSQTRDLIIGLMARSLSTEGLNRVKLRAKNLAYLANCYCEITNDYPAWTPNLEAIPLKVLQQTYLDLYNVPLDIEVIHAGLETGLIGKLYPHLEMVSFGPTIHNAHSPDECVHIPSVANFYDLLKALLANLK